MLTVNNKICVREFKKIIFGLGDVAIATKFGEKQAKSYKTGDSFSCEYSIET